MLAVLGILAALVERAHSGRGQVIDASILDGTLLTGAIDRFVRVGDRWGQPGSNSLDGGSRFYRCYRTADNRAVSFGALEPNFHENMLREFGIDPAEVDQFDETAWPTLSERIQAIVETGTAEQWCERFNGVEACFCACPHPRGGRFTPAGRGSFRAHSRRRSAGTIASPPDEQDAPAQDSFDQPGRSRHGTHPRPARDQPRGERPTPQQRLCPPSRHEVGRAEEPGMTVTRSATGVPFVIGGPESAFRVAPRHGPREPVPRNDGNRELGHRA